MTREEARKHFEAVKAEVNKLPLWQQNLLKDSLQSTLPEPRQPVSSQKSGSDKKGNG